VNLPGVAGNDQSYILGAGDIQQEDQQGLHGRGANGPYLSRDSMTSQDQTARLIYPTTSKSLPQTEKATAVSQVRPNRHDTECAE
jgi:hypothetical protein